MDGDKLIQLVADLLERYGLEPSNQAVIGDLADLALSVRRLEVKVRDLLSLADSPTDNEALQAALAALAHEVTHMRMVCADLAEPLDELIDDEAQIQAILGGVEDTLSSFSGAGRQADARPPQETFTAQARRLWEAVSAREQTLILNNVYCTSCRRTTTLVRFTGRTQDGDLILEGQCERCGSEVSRLVEGIGR